MKQVSLITGRKVAGARRFAAGLSWLWHDRVVRLLTVIVTGLGLMDGMVGAILVLFALDELGTGRAGFGLLLSVAAVGSIVGTLAAPRLARRARVKTLLVLSTVGAGTAYLLMAGAPAAPVAAVFLAANSAMVMLWNVLTAWLRQRLIAPELLGRVTACYRMAAWGALPLGGLLGGALAGQIGIRSVVVTAGAGVVLLSALVLLLPGDEVQPRPAEGSGA